MVNQGTLLSKIPKGASVKILGLICGMLSTVAYLSTIYGECGYSKKASTVAILSLMGVIVGFSAWMIVPF